MAASMVAGTLALYQTQIDSVATGDVAAKTFVFKAEKGSYDWSTAVKIAPGEEFYVPVIFRNYEGSSQSEVDIQVAVAAPTVTVKVAGDASTKLVSYITATLVTTNDGVDVAPTAAELKLDKNTNDSFTYYIAVKWPAGTANASTSTKTGADSQTATDGNADKIGTDNLAIGGVVTVSLNVTGTQVAS